MTLIIIITLTDAITKFNDYSHARYIPIEDGDVTIWDKFGYIGHSTNISSYETYAREARKILDLFTMDHMTKVLRTDFGRIDTLKDTLRVHHRQTRSLNLLGTALKVVAGTPDFDDWEHIKFKQEQLIEAENRQVEINAKIQEQINTVTRTLNSIHKSDKTDSDHLFETVLAENGAIITDLENLLLTLTLA